jgi:hypothetical protein
LDYKFCDEEMQIVTIREYLENLENDFGDEIIDLYDDYIENIDDIMVKGAVDD